VNPNSGPGERPLPGHDYVREVPKLNVHANVSTVGYVRIDYCKKPLNEVYEEIEAYAGWAKSTDYEKSRLGVGGILLDETPNHYTPERAEYLDAVHQYVKATEGLQGKRLVSCPFRRCRGSSEAAAPPCPAGLSGRPGFELFSCLCR
jgi:hypothetical protein